MRQISPSRGPFWLIDLSPASDAAPQAIRDRALALSLGGSPMILGRVHPRRGCGEPVSRRDSRGRHGKDAAPAVRLPSGVRWPAARAPAGGDLSHLDRARWHPYYEAREVTVP